MIGDAYAETKARLKNFSPDAIRRLVAAQPEVTGDVTIDKIRLANPDAGLSSGTLMFDARWTERGRPQSQSLVLRYAPVGADRLFFRYDVAQQFKVQQALQSTAVPTPRPRWLDADGRHLGMPGFAMERVDAEALDSGFQSGPLAHASLARRNVVTESLLSTLANLHAVDLKSAGLENHMFDVSGSTPLARIINYRWATWDWIRTFEHDRLLPVRKWLIDNEPAGLETVMLHGDPNYSNYLVRGDKVVSVVDWESSSIGPPELDIAIQLGINRLVRMRSDASVASRVPSDEEWISAYEHVSGRKLCSMKYFNTLFWYMVIVSWSAVCRTLGEDARQRQREVLDFYWSNVEGDIQA